MSDCINTFFEAWQLEVAQDRLATINRAVIEGVHYADPRTPEPIVGVEALHNYVAMFSANAPGWSASVVKSDTISDVTRVTVAFGGKGPDGSMQIQHGQYFVEKDGDKISRMVGFVGTGEQQ
ncbi:MAG: hypothetical protein KTR16_00935 [Acidiferrobacterales bacterium]|nr:hypothetical protein [Acidiferrobacterales bacterium]